MQFHKGAGQSREQQKEGDYQHDVSVTVKNNKKPFSTPNIETAFTALGGLLPAWIWFTFTPDLFYYGLDTKIKWK